MTKKTETLEFLKRISVLEDRFEKIGKMIIPELDIFYEDTEISYDVWNYKSTVLKYKIKHLKYKDFDLCLKYDSICATISKKEVWLWIIPEKVEDKLRDVFLCNYIDFKDGNWYIEVLTNPESSNISAPIILTDAIINSIFEKVRYYIDNNSLEMNKSIENKKMIEAISKNEKINENCASSKLLGLYYKILNFFKLRKTEF